MVGFSPCKRNTWVQLHMKREEKGDHTATPSPLCLSSSPPGRGPLSPPLMLKATSDGQLAFFYTNLFLCKQNNSSFTSEAYIQDIWLHLHFQNERRSINSFSIEETMNTDVVLLPKHTTWVSVCGQVC